MFTTKYAVSIAQRKHYCHFYHGERCRISIITFRTYINRSFADVKVSYAVSSNIRKPITDPVKSKKSKGIVMRTKSTLITGISPEQFTFK